MKSVKEVSKISGISVRTLHHYDAIGLLKPTALSDAGYRLYDDAALERLQQILLFRELEFSLKDIKKILESKNFDRNVALEQQITLLTLKKEHIENLILLARGIKMMGVNKMDFTAFDTSKIDEYSAQAKASYAKTPQWREYEEKSKGRTPAQTEKLNVQMMEIFSEFGTLRELPTDSEKVQLQVKKLKDFITENFYDCSDEVLLRLGKMYAGGGDLTEHIDKAGGEGTGEFVFAAINEYCSK